MDSILAKSLGYDYFQVEYGGVKRKVYKVGWYISGVGETYVLCLYYWRPRNQRVRNHCNSKRPQDLKSILRNRQDPDEGIPVYSGKWCEYDDRYVKALIETIKRTGKIDFDRYIKWLC